MRDLLAAAQAAALTWWQSLLIGTAGSVVTLIGVLITLSFNRRSETSKLEHEIKKRELEERREKVSRLRPYRIELLFEAQKHLEHLAQMLMTLSDEYDEQKDWREPREKLSRMLGEGRDLRARLKLLFTDAPLPSHWSQYVAHLKVLVLFVGGVDGAREYDLRMVRDVLAEVEVTQDSLREAMQRIDRE